MFDLKIYRMYVGLILTTSKKALVKRGMTQTYIENDVRV